jgi:uncharacterized protein (TIGR00369 family)
MNTTLAEERFDRIPYVRTLGIRIDELTPDHVVLRMPHDPDHDNGNATLNGGATGSLINVAGAMAAWTGIDFDTDPVLRTVDMSVQYLSAVIGEDVLAKARILKRGRDVFFLDVALATPEGRPVCQGLMIYRSPDYDGHAPRMQTDFNPRPAAENARPWQSEKILKEFGVKLKMSPIAIGPGYVRMAMAGEESNQDEQGQVHDGAIAALADFGGTVTAWSLVDDWRNVRGSTVGMQLSYAEPARGKVIVDGYLEHRSEEAFISSVAVTDAEDGHLVCMGQVSYRLLEPR